MPGSAAARRRAPQEPVDGNLTRDRGSDPASVLPGGAPTRCGGAARWSARLARIGSGIVAAPASPRIPCAERRCNARSECRRRAPSARESFHSNSKPDAAVRVQTVNASRRVPRTETATRRPRVIPIVHRRPAEPGGPPGAHGETGISVVSARRPNSSTLEQSFELKLRVRTRRSSRIQRFRGRFRRAARSRRGAHARRM